MCGITGFWQNNVSADAAHDALRTMTSTLAHRGPDDCGTLLDDSGRLGLGHRRLSIIDLSAEGRQPMRSASGRFAIAFNGEIYNFEELRAELKGVAWRGHSDTEVMLAAIEQWGLKSALNRFVGMFAFALWDSHQRCLYLVRDRLGIKPLYYARIGRNFVFASELKAIAAFPGFERCINRNVLSMYARFGYIPAPYSIYEGVEKLSAGSILSLAEQDGVPTVEQFWSAEEMARASLEKRCKTSCTDLMDELQEKLTDAVRLRMIADVPLGAFLSGGIDSSTVVALMQSLSSRPVRTFTIGFEEDRYDEASYARRVAAHLGTEHTEISVTPQQALDVIPLLPRMYDEPFADSSAVPTYLISKLARNRVTVALSGDGGDELFGGYFRYTLARSVWNAVRLAGPVVRIAANLARVSSPAAIDALARYLPVQATLKRSAGDRAHKLAAHLLLRSRENIYLQTLSQWPEPDSLVLNCREPQTILHELRGLSWIASTEEMGMLCDLQHYLPEDILTKVDRASMAVGLEVRVPILDHRVVEFAWTVPLEMKVRQGQSKWLLRQLLYRFVPRELIDRPKMGFTIPMDVWLRGPLREWAEDRLSTERLRSDGFFNVAQIRKRWDEHLSGRRNWQHALWTVLFFQDWHATLKAPSGPAERNRVCERDKASA
jgi:asparagine synthase (glutamine-hydrolysing)